MKRAVIHCSQLVTMATHGSRKPCRGPELKEVGAIKDGAIITDGSRIYAVGTTYSLKEKLKEVPEENIVDARGHVVMPGFVDSHTHAIFAGTREKEFHWRVQGKPYMEILAEGGGILESRRAFQESSDEAILSESSARFARMLQMGTTTVEVKSGYGLSTDQEIRTLELLSQLQARESIEIHPTFMGAHAVPPEFKRDPDSYVALVINEMLPIIARRKLATFQDVFCEAGVFTVEQTEKILQKGLDYGLKPRLHCDEIEAIGATELACSVGALSADHLVAVTESGMKALANTDTIANLLPGTVYSLMKKAPPARKMIEAGCAIGLATDCNPGSCYTESMPMILSLASTLLKLSAEEALVAATFNGACALGQQERIGSLEMMKEADLLLLHCKDYRELAYHFGINPVARVMKSGEWVVS